MTEHRHRLLIIGGGMAGLSAGYYLARHGFTDFRILEARRRIGGRIVQITVGGGNSQSGGERVELGANWIHGILGNPVYELALEHGLLDIMQSPRTHKVIASTEQGKQVPFAVLQEIYEAYLCFLRRCEEYFVTQYLPPDGIESVGDHIRLEIGLYLDNVADPADRQLRQLIFDCLLKRETCISGCDSMNEIDLLELGSYTELQGGNITLPNGYSAILDPIKRMLPDGCILTECAVQTINWDTAEGDCDEDGSAKSDESDKTVIIDNDTETATSETESTSAQTGNVTKGSRKTQVEVTCENGDKYQADAVICTIPLGVLKHQAATMFQPSLPEYKLDAINNLLFGTVDKILLEYDRPFLNANITEILLLWNSSSDTTTTRIADNWYKKIYSFSKVSETLLLGWISGREAEYMETLSSQVVIDVCTDILRRFLNDPFVPKPRSCICTSWHSQPYTRGSYTALRVGSSQLDIEALAQPLYGARNVLRPAVLFAGEHTHSSFYSTVHGAYLSGRTAAHAYLDAVEEASASKMASSPLMQRRHQDSSAPMATAGVAGAMAPLSSQHEIFVDCDSTDLSSWIQGICLD